jgi:putative heme iron utilization protein
MPVVSDSTADADLHAALAADPGAIIETVAKKHNVPLRRVVEALPVAMRRFAPAEAFVDVMSAVAG